MTIHQEFWQDFEKYAPRLLLVMQHDDVPRAFDAVEHLLTGYSYNFCFELSLEDDRGLLVFSPEGDEEVAVQIDSFVAAAPRLAGWRIIGRRERKPVADVASIVKHLYDLDPTEARFVINHEQSCGPGVAIYLPAAHDFPEEAQRGLAAMILWNALGEDLVMRQRIGARVFDTVPPENETSMSLDELRVRFPEA